MPKPFEDLSVFEKIIYILGVGVGSGLSPKAPGTAGSFVVLPLVWLWLSIGWGWSALVLLIASVLGFYICGKTAHIMGVHDDGRIVWDEFVGQSMTFLPLCFYVPSPSAIAPIWLLGLSLTAFALFRLFDICKPWPIGAIDRQVHGGLGIMLDDMIAGVMAGACFWLVLCAVSRYAISLNRYVLVV